jgi:hypothetical protein
MARPRKLKFGEGEITLSGYTPEEADKIQEWISNVHSGVPSIARGPQVGDMVEITEDKLEVIDTTTLVNTALDLYQEPDTKQWKLVSIKYNPVSGLAKAEDAKVAGINKYDAINKFKIELFNMRKI